MDRPRTIGIATQMWTNLDRQVIRGIVEYGSRRHHFSFRDLVFSRDEEVPPRLIQLGCAGAILNMRKAIYDTIASELPAIPYVNIGNESLAPHIPSVCGVMGEGTRMLMAHCREKGFDHFAYITVRAPGSEPINAHNIQRELSPAEKFVGICYLGVTDWDTEGARCENEIAAWLKKNLQQGKRTALFCDDGRCAGYAVAACDGLELEIPAQIGVVSYVEELSCLTPIPAITAIQTGRYELGYTAMRELTRMLQGKQPTASLVQAGHSTVVVRGSTAEPDPHRDDVEVAVEFFERNLENDISLEDCLAHIGTISRAQLFRSFSQQMGVTPMAYLRGLRIQRAKEMLIGTSLNITQISNLCGFTSLSSFTAAFRRETGKSPRGFRESLEDKPPKS